LKSAKFILHLYPPFLYTKCYLDISRRATFHFDSPSLSWKQGEYFSLNDIFSNLEGKLRIGVQYKIESFFETIQWYILLIISSLLIIGYNELKQSMKLGEKRGFILFEIFRTIKTAINIFRLKNINIKRERLENEVNKIYNKFLKNYNLSDIQKKQNLNSNNNTRNSLTLKNHVEIYDC
jgi:hypothetical protein